MKYIIKIGSVVIVTMFAFNAFASNYYMYRGSHCENKRRAIEMQIENAQRYNNINRLIGLETALSKINYYCNDSNLEGKYKEKIEDKMEKVRERELDLRKAEIDGRYEKIAKQERKLREAQAELDGAKAQLDAFYRGLKY